MNVCCGTGHRPNKLYKTYSGESYIIKAIEQAIPNLGTIDKGISGMALGFDTALAKVFIKLGIPWVAAVPFKGQESRWPMQSQREYNKILSQASQIVYVDEVNKEYPGYSAEKMQRRNEWMCDNSNVVLALWDGTAGGTCNCVGYAMRKGLKVENIWSTYKEITS